MQAIKLFQPNTLVRKKSAILHNEYLSGHPLPPPQGAVYTIQWSDCKHGAKQFWHSLRLPDLFFCCCCFFLKKWCSLRWKKRNVSNQLDKQCGNIDKTQQFNHSTIKTGHCVYSASVSYYLHLVKVRFITLKLHEVYRVFLAWRQTDVKLSEHFCTEDKLSAAFWRSAQQEQKLQLFCSFCCCDKNWKRHRRSWLKAKRHVHMHVRCSLLRWISYWAKHERRAKDIPFNHNVTI